MYYYELKEGIEKYIEDHGLEETMIDITTLLSVIFIDLRNKKNGSKTNSPTRQPQTSSTAKL